MQYRSERTGIRGARASRITCGLASCGGVSGRRMSQKSLRSAYRPHSSYSYPLWRFLGVGRAALFPCCRGMAGTLALLAAAGRVFGDSPGGSPSCGQVRGRLSAWTADALLPLWWWNWAWSASLDGSCRPILDDVLRSRACWRMVTEKWINILGQTATMSWA